MNSVGHVWLKCFDSLFFPNTLPIKSGTNGHRDLAHFQGSPFRVSVLPPYLTSPYPLRLQKSGRKTCEEGRLDPCLGSLGRQECLGRLSKSQAPLSFPNMLLAIQDLPESTRQNIKTHLEIVQHAQILGNKPKAVRLLVLSSMHLLIIFRTILYTKISKELLLQKWDFSTM